MTQTARVYGGSLYDLAAEEYMTDILMDQMKEIHQIFKENPDYVRLLKEPSIPKKERTAMLEEAFGNQAERYLVSFLKILVERGLLGEYGDCVKEFNRRYNRDHGIEEAIVTSAVALSKEQAETLKKTLEAKSGKKIVLIQKVDPALLAGICVELEGKQLDGSVQGRISGISRKLSEIIV